ncbi:MAG: DNA-nicking Smr family endonuclease [Porticoccaceae bacterium]|jgi:DNA-nicking Smr family endonuclease|tara:strand:- start:1014 stop:1643 length:630 start_codon:yes stop_codon:yes gene_type:complete
MSSTDGWEKSELDKLSDKQFVDMVGDDIQPLSGKGSAHIAKPVQVTPGVLERRKAAQEEVVAESNILDPASIIEQVDPLAYLEFVRPGVQHGVYKNLRLGKYEIQSRLDLHRHTVEQARNALWHFVDDCHKHGVRCALVTHGKGEGREQPARLKSCVNHWLRQFDQVLAFHSAQKTHGGVGATYILVKKDSSARRETGDKINQAKRMKR